MKPEIIKQLIEKKGAINKLMQENGASELKVFGSAVGHEGFGNLEQLYSLFILIMPGDRLDQRHIEKLTNELDNLFNNLLIKYYTPAFLKESGELTEEQQVKAKQNALSLDDLIKLTQAEAKKKSPDINLVSAAMRSSVLTQTMLPVTSSKSDTDPTQVTSVEFETELENLISKHFPNLNKSHWAHEIHSIIQQESKNSQKLIK